MGWCWVECCGEQYGSEIEVDCFEYQCEVGLKGVEIDDENEMCCE